MRRQLRVVIVTTLTAALAGLAWGAPAGLAASPDEPADAVLTWNVNATTAIVGVARQPPHAASISFAMVQGAVYDAVNAIDGSYQPYLAAPLASPSDSKAAAAATAAYRVLLGLFPGQAGTLDTQYGTSLGLIPDGAPKSGGIAVGEAAAAAMLAARAGDGRGGPSAAVPGDDVGEWRPEVPAFATDPAGWVGNVKPFLIPRGDFFRSDGPNALTSAAYAADFNEVKTLGSLTSTKRTADQTDASLFWQDHGLALWNRIFRSLATAKGLDIADAARLFAMEDLAAADALISCWNDKYFWSFWRPITAIRQADLDGNPATAKDAGWVPLFGTPPFPDHPSGHGCASGAIVKTLQRFFGTDKIAFSAFSNNSQTTRSFDRFSEAIKEIIDARVWSGIHFRTADVQGSVIGMKVSHWLVKHYFQPVD